MTEKHTHTPADAEDFKVYKKRPDPHYSEKGSHLERTLANDERKGGHRKHFKKRR